MTIFLILALALAAWGWFAFWCAEDKLAEQREQAQRLARLLRPSSRSYEIDLSAWGDQ